MAAHAVDSKSNRGSEPLADEYGTIHEQGHGEDPLALWGDPDANENTWMQHNPYDLAPQLKGVRLFISAGNGRPGPLDRSGITSELALAVNPSLVIVRVSSYGQFGTEEYLGRPG